MVIEDTRTPEEVQYTIGFWVATDRFMSGWGKAKGRSLFAIPVFSWKDIDDIKALMESRSDLQRLRYVAGNVYRPKMAEGDHLRICHGGTWRGNRRQS